MGFLRNVLRRLRNSAPRMDWYKHKHEDCVNFDNGVCINAPRFLNLTNLNPKGQSCPHFKAKEKVEAEKI